MSKRLLGPVTAALVIVILLPVTTLLVVAWLLGWQLQAVLSGSMAPTYPAGSLLVVGPVDASEVRPGMAIVFEDPDAPRRLVTHRVVGIAPGPALQFATQGDANATPDPSAVPARMIRGRVLWHINGLGNVLPWLEWPTGPALLVVLPGALLLLSERKARSRTAQTI